MPPTRPDQLGERLSGLEAAFGSFEKYEHDRWHALNNTLQPLVGLPLQLTRDIAKIQGTFDGRIATITREIERSITAAVEKAIEPVNADVTRLKADVEELKAAQLQEAGAKNFSSRLLQSPVISGFIGAILAGLAFAWAVMTGKVP
jgi:hypothetical protein